VEMAIPNRKPYRYLPITDHDGIRLIVLQPSVDKAATVQCEILHVTLRQAQDEICDHYTALSYVWGDPNDTTTILVEGCLLRVTKSLERAFRYLRDDKRLLNVWADGVCINQKDEDEKGKQVQQMGRVYETAHHTVIFLGECEPAAEAALSRGLSYFEDGTQVGRIGTDLEVVKVLKQLLNCSWFYRVWIFQELVMSHDPKIQYGRIRFSWKALYPLKHLVKEITQTGGQSAAFAGTILNLDQEFKLVAQMNAAKSAFEILQSTTKYCTDINSGERPVNRDVRDFEKFLGILDSRRGFGASNPRDLIFAHLGIVNPLILKVDYGKTTSHVYEMFTWKYISTTGSLEVFAHIDDIDLLHRRQGLPSWVPDWTLRQANPRRRTLKHAGFEYNPLSYLNMGLNSLWGTSVLYHESIISLKAVTFESSVGKLSRVIDTALYESSRFHSPQLGAPAPQEWLATQAGPDVEFVYLESEDLLSSNSNRNERYKEGVRHLSHLLLEQLGQSERQGGCILDGRRLASVPYKERDRLALVPASTKIGDLIFYLLGCKVPFVFRKVQNRTRANSHVPRVHLVGECLIDLVDSSDTLHPESQEQPDDWTILELEAKKEWAGGIGIE
jgi:hypothetical protein